MKHRVPSTSFIVTIIYQSTLLYHNPPQPKTRPKTTIHIVQSAVQLFSWLILCYYWALPYPSLENNNKDWVLPVPLVFSTPFLNLVIAAYATVTGVTCLPLLETESSKTSFYGIDLVCHHLCNYIKSTIQLSSAPAKFSVSVALHRIWSLHQQHLIKFM